ncbi:Major Facilitator Superfamily [Anaerococcus prevotii]|uniref:Major facilitator superfamily MFS_1 n=1 Tax=Anaerococcus prevotii (strain ATCC 9321 / DSM 20548 / JCM 6508 / NCTC 11806 / PC1) TaxID=525919 RepID=C7RFU6_ANAPD|nr:MFS transporter [Anaerococcus prevotii]ACV28357.1 major facilitator superfamily MFS_1 [Anaerococcus prevotii DSM 20548]SUU93912.1 Major Facilitator Superfamily [Anaerococcus prevotii]
MKALRKNKLREAAILSMALITAGNSAISGILVFMQKEFALTRQASEFVITLSSIATIISIALSESITRLIGMKKCVQLGTILVFISGIIPIIHTSYQTILLSRIILGFGMGLFNGHSANYISALFTGEKAAFLHGMRSSMEYIGQMALLLIAGFLIKIKWPLAFLCYTFSIFVFLFFSKYVEDIRPEERKGRFFINKQVIFYIFFAGVMIMNITSLSIRFPTIATLQKGMDANINAYMIIIPLSGMAAGFSFGYINRALREKTILFALINYILANIIVTFWGSNMYIFMAAMLISAASQSIASPYLFAEAMRFARGSQNRIINNLIFIGCNIGGFISPAFLFIINKILGTESLTQAFLGFSLIYLFLFLVYFYEYIKVKRRGII